MTVLERIASIGTKTLLWPLVFANGGTLVCLIFGRSNLFASALGLASVVFGLVLMMRYAVSQRARANSSKRKAVPVSEMRTTRPRASRG